MPRNGAWSVGDGVLAVLAGLIGATLAVYLAGPNLTAGETFGVVVPVQTAATVAAIAGVARRRPPWRESLGVSVGPGDGWGLLVGASLQVGLSFLVAAFVIFFLGGEAPQQEIVNQAEEATGLLVRIMAFLGAVVLAPAVEELVFRGIILRALLAGYGRRVALYGSSAGFALLHLLDPAALIAVPVLFIVGIVMGEQTLRTGRLGRAYFTHAGFNLVSVVLLFVLE